MSELELVEWRRRVGELYAAVRAHTDPEGGHALWRAGRDALYRFHPQSPLPADYPMRRNGLPYWPYDPALRFYLPIVLSSDQPQVTVSTGTDGTTAMHRIGFVRLPAPLDADIDVWWLDQYGGGLFLPLRDGTAGDTSYGGGRYLLDTAKSADLGGDTRALVVDLNFLYHPSCRYSSEWTCPLAAAGNTIDQPVRAGERL
jgi:uncharacterized protein